METKGDLSGREPPLKMTEFQWKCKTSLLGRPFCIHNVRVKKYSLNSEPVPLNLAHS
jgi:hypothetical protein